MSNKNVRKGSFADKVAEAMESVETPVTLPEVDEADKGIAELIAKFQESNQDISFRVTKVESADKQTCSWVISLKYGNEIGKLGVYVADMNIKGIKMPRIVSTSIVGSSMRMVFENHTKGCIEVLFTYLERCITVEIDKLKDAAGRKSKKTTRKKKGSNGGSKQNG